MHTYELNYPFECRKRFLKKTLKIIIFKDIRLNSKFKTGKVDESIIIEFMIY